jgi:O-acetyl-ADP-ribose deacetylase (regulator of RNase III)
MTQPNVTLKEGSLTDGDELVLVNASNTNLMLGSGVSGAIRKACGPAFQQQILDVLQREFGGPSMPPGSVLLTSAGAHPKAKFVAHLAVMDYRGGFSPESMPSLATVRTCCEHLWPQLEHLPGNGPLTVAMVAIGAGTGNLGVLEPTKITCETLVLHLRSHPTSRLERVTFYGYLLHEYIAIARVLIDFFPEVKNSLTAEAASALEKLR